MITGNGHAFLAPPSNKRFEIKNKFSLIVEATWLLMLVVPVVLWKLIRKLFPSQEKSLKGQVALVTGAGRGIGKGLALALAREGCVVAVVDLYLDTAKDTAQEICKVGGRAEAFCTNVSKTEEVRALQVAVTQALGPVDVLVNNAGILYGEPIDTCSEALVKGIISVNLLAHFWMAREFVPTMKKRNSGHIVGISSCAAFSPLANASAYVASKYAVRGLMEVLRAELEAVPGNQVRTTTVFPYFVDTSADYVDHWDLRFPVMSIDRVVMEVISGIKRNQVSVTIPTYLYYLSHIKWLLPEYIQDKAMHMMGIHIYLPDQKSALSKEANNMISGCSSFDS